MKGTDVSEAVGVVAAEVAGALRAIPYEAVATAAALLADRERRLFFCGQGRSGLVARMAAMRWMHLGFTAHVVGETTTPAITADDVLVAISGSGETPTVLHTAGLADGFGAPVLAVVTRSGSSLSRIARAVLQVPTPETVQFGTTLFDQCALLVLDAVAMVLTGAEPAASADMHTRHANLQ